MNSPVFVPGCKEEGRFLPSETEISQGSAFLHLSPGCFAQLPAQPLQQVAALSHSTTGRKISVSLLSHLNLQMRGAWRVVTNPFTNSAWLFSPSVPVHLSCKAPSPGRCPKATPEGWYVKTSNFFFFICSLYNVNSSMSVSGTQTTGLFLCLQFMTSFSCCLLLIHKPPEVPSSWNGHGGLWSWEHRKPIRPS